MKKYLIEFIGTFFLVTTIGLTGNPLAIGIMLTILVYMGGHISGAHYNPAVTISIFCKKLIEGKEAINYIITQLIASFLAAVLVFSINTNLMHVAPDYSYSSLQIILCELIFTFLLVLVILNVATNKKTEGNSYYGLAIGFTVMASAYCVGGVSGGAFNPAVAFGPALLDIFSGTGKDILNFWIYLVGPISGGYLAFIVDKYVNN
jgi:aquaporin Z